MEKYDNRHEITKVIEETIKTKSSITIYLKNLNRIPENLRKKNREIDPSATILAKNNTTKKCNYLIIEIPADGKCGVEEPDSKHTIIAQDINAETAKMLCNQTRNRNKIFT